VAADLGTTLALVLGRRTVQTISKRSAEWLHELRFSALNRRSPCCSRLRLQQGLRAWCCSI